MLLRTAIKKPLHFNVSLEHIAKNITGSYLIEEKAEIHKVSKSIFNEELDEESQRYLQKSLEDWKSRITENIEKQYDDYDLYEAIDDLDKKAIYRFIDKMCEEQSDEEPERKTWRWRK